MGETELFLLITVPFLSGLGDFNIDVVCNWAGETKSVTRNSFVFVPFNKPAKSNLSS